MTVLSLVQSAAGVRFEEADQSITAVRATGDTCTEIEVEEGSPVIRIDRLYFNVDKAILELAVNYFNPARYSYRFHMRATQE